MNAKEQNMESARNKVQSWLMSEGWQISEQAHPDFAWLIQAEDAGGRKMVVGQSKARQDLVHLEAVVDPSDEYRELFANLPEDSRREILWKLRFQLLSMNVDFTGVGEPLEAILLTQRIYLDGLTKDAFIQRFHLVRNAVIAVIWSIIQHLEGVEPPAESTELTVEKSSKQKK
jgi:hypothetical protein